MSMKRGWARCMKVNNPAKHPAPYTKTFLPIFEEWVGRLPRVLDPMGGTGKLKEAIPHAICMDLEMEWARLAGLRANALSLPFAKDTFDAICVSPVYGNRMSDKTPGRVSYTAYKGAPLHEDNSGQMQWGEKYRQFHKSAWQECHRVLKSGGRFVLNIKDHIRNKTRQYVTVWHINALYEIGFDFLDHVVVPVVGSATHLANGDLRIPYESVILLEKSI